MQSGRTLRALQKATVSSEVRISAFERAEQRTTAKRLGLAHLQRLDRRQPGQRSGKAGRVPRSCSSTPIHRARANPPNVTAGCRAEGGRETLAKLDVPASRTPGRFHDVSGGLHPCPCLGPREKVPGLEPLDGG